MELVAGFGMAYFRPCLTMIRGGDAAEGSDILQTANRNLTHRECLMVCVWEPNPHKEMNGPDPHLVDT